MDYTLMQACFVTSSPDLLGCPPPLYAEVVFLGRSNVGKSSLINLLCNHKGLAKSSSTPGKTRLINFFGTKWKRGDQCIELYFVDLPGFGYAKVSKGQKQAWLENMSSFIKERQAIKLFVHLIDSRHSNLALDALVVEFVLGFLRSDQKLLTIFTKCDKLNASQTQKLKNSHPNALFASILQKSNVQELRNKLISAAIGEMG